MTLSEFEDPFCSCKISTDKRVAQSLCNSTASCLVSDYLLKSYQVNLPTCFQILTGYSVLKLLKIKLDIVKTKLAHLYDTFLPSDALLSVVNAVVVCLSVCLAVCLCVCVSDTLRYCIKTAKRRITQITPHDNPVTLVF